MQGSSRENETMRAAKAARTKGPPASPLTRADDTKVSGSGKLNWTKASLRMREIMAERLRDVSYLH